MALTVAHSNVSTPRWTARRAVRVDPDAYETVFDWAEDTACEGVAIDLFFLLDPNDTGIINKAHVLDLWPALSRHVNGRHAEMMFDEFQRRSAPIDRNEWMTLMAALRSVTGARRFRNSIRGAESLLAERREAQLDRIALAASRRAAGGYLVDLPGAVPGSPYQNPTSEEFHVEIPHGQLWREDYSEAHTGRARESEFDLERDELAAEASLTEVLEQTASRDAELCHVLAQRDAEISCLRGMLSSLRSGEWTRTLFSQIEGDSGEASAPSSRDWFAGQPAKTQEELDREGPMRQTWRFVVEQANAREQELIAKLVAKDFEIRRLKELLRDFGSTTGGRVADDKALEDAVAEMEEDIDAQRMPSGWPSRQASLAPSEAGGEKQVCGSYDEAASREEVAAREEIAPTAEVAASGSPRAGDIAAALEVAEAAAVDEAVTAAVPQAALEEKAAPREEVVAAAGGTAGASLEERDAVAASNMVDATAGCEEEGEEGNNSRPEAAAIEPPHAAAASTSTRPSTSGGRTRPSSSSSAHRGPGDPIALASKPLDQLTPADAAEMQAFLKRYNALVEQKGAAAPKKAAAKPKVQVPVPADAGGSSSSKGSAKPRPPLPETERKMALSESAPVLPVAEKKMRSAYVQTLKYETKIPAGMVTAQEMDAVKSASQQLEEMLRKERMLHLQTTSRLSHIEKQLLAAKQDAQLASHKKHFGITSVETYKSSPGAAPVTTSPQAKRGAIYLPALRTMPKAKPRSGSAFHRKQEEIAAASEAALAEDEARLATMPRVDQSRTRIRAIVKMEGLGMNTWKLRKAEKVSKLQALDSFSNNIWDSFFGWQDDVDAVD